MYTQSAYTYLSTSDPALAERFLRLHPDATVDGASTGPRRLAAGLGNPLLRQINEAGPGRPDLALRSRAALEEGRFSASADFWGLQNHFFHQQDGTFAASDNIFALKALLGSPPLDREALLETLFFTSPMGDRTWFQGIRTLLPGQTMSHVDGRLELDAGTDFATWFDAPGRGIKEEAEDFYRALRDHLGKTPAHLSLSAGFDSRTILAALRHYGFDFQCFCFGERHYLEKDQVRALTRRLGITLGFIELTDFENQFEASFDEGMRLSNGYLNPLRTHYLEYYRKLPDTGVFFEGILGSEFVKGEISWPTMTSTPMKRVIADGGRPAEVIAATFPELDEGLRRDLAAYVQDVHGDVLGDVNKPGGSRAYAEFAFRFIPRRIFAGVVPLASSRMPVVYPYLHPPFLRAVFRAGHGIRNRSSLDCRFPTALKSFEAEALLVREIDPTIFGMQLDRGVSYRQALYPKALGTAIRAWNLGLARTLRDRRKFAGQIDNTRIIQRIAERANLLERPAFEARNPGGNLELARLLLTYDAVQRL